MVSLLVDHQLKTSHIGINQRHGQSLVYLIILCGDISNKNACVTILWQTIG